MPDRIWCCDSELSEGEKSTGRHSGLVLNIVNIATIMTSFSQLPAVKIKEAPVGFAYHSHK